MTIEEYKKTIKEPLRQRTVAFLLKDEEVLLGKKKRGFGAGYIIGIGGKREEQETLEQAAIRELNEEIGIDVHNLEHRGFLNFYFPFVDAPEKWNQQVHIFLVTEWKSEIKESDEIAPLWFEKEKVPYELMWEDAKYWLPKVLQGEHIEAEFLFDIHQKVLQVNFLGEYK